MKACGILKFTITQRVFHPPRARFILLSDGVYVHLIVQSRSRRSIPLQLFLNIWAAVGPLLGVGLGSWLTMKNQRKQWILDNKRAEYRKLLTTLTESASHFAMIYGATPVVMAERDQRLLAETAKKSGNVIYSRLFIADEIEKLKIMGRWQNTIDALRKNQDAATFVKGLDGIMNDIRGAALKDFRDL